MANNFSSVPSHTAIPQFGYAPNSARMNPSSSDVDFDFDFLTQYLLFDDADVDISSSLTQDHIEINSKLLNCDGLPSNNAFKVDKGIGEIDNSFVPSAYSMMPTAIPIVKTEKGGIKARSSNQGAPIEKEKLRNNKAHFKSNVEFSSNDPNTKDDDCTSLDTEYSAGKKRKSESVKGVLSEKINKRRARNKVLAKQTRYRKKFFFESLQRQVALLAMENQRLRDTVRSCERIPSDVRERVLSSCTWVQPDIITSCAAETSTAVLEPMDFRLVAAIQAQQKNFIITDPSIPDNPIIFASQGFLDLTGYPMNEVLGRNCRFLQGSESNRQDIATLGQGIAAGMDTSVCLLNYRKDGTPFYNQIYVAPLRDADMKIINYVGVQVEIKTDMMPDSMLIEKCTDLKPPNGPKVSTKGSGGTASKKGMSLSFSAMLFAQPHSDSSARSSKPMLISDTTTSSSSRNGNFNAMASMDVRHTNSNINYTSHTGYVSQTSSSYTSDSGSSSYATTGGGGGGGSPRAGSMAAGLVPSARAPPQKAKQR